MRYNTYLGQLLDLLDFSRQLCDVFVEMRAELVDVGVTLSERLVYRVSNSRDGGRQCLWNDN